MWQQADRAEIPPPASQCHTSPAPSPPRPVPPLPLSLPHPSLLRYLSTRLGFIFASTAQGEPQRTWHTCMMGAEAWHIIQPWQIFVLLPQTRATLLDGFEPSVILRSDSVASLFQLFGGQRNRVSRLGAPWHLCFTPAARPNDNRKEEAGISERTDTKAN